MPPRPAMPTALPDPPLPAPPLPAPPLPGAPAWPGAPPADPAPPGPPLPAVPALEVAADPALAPEPPTFEGPDPPLELSDAPALPPEPWPAFPVSGSDADEQPRSRARAETTAVLRCRVLMSMGVAASCRGGPFRSLRVTGTNTWKVPMSTV